VLLWFFDATVCSVNKDLDIIKYFKKHKAKMHKILCREIASVEEHKKLQKQCLYHTDHDSKQQNCSILRSVEKPNLRPRFTNLIMERRGSLWILLFLSAAEADDVII